jgi:hypothetical protein
MRRMGGEVQGADGDMHRLRDGLGGLKFYCSVQGFSFLFFIVIIPFFYISGKIYSA